MWKQCRMYVLKLKEERRKEEGKTNDERKLNEGRTKEKKKKIEKTEETYNIELTKLKLKTKTEN